MFEDYNELIEIEDKQGNITILTRLEYMVQREFQEPTTEEIEDIIRKFDEV